MIGADGQGLLWTILIACLIVAVVLWIVKHI